jgi:hypothetical protein
MVLFVGASGYARAGVSDVEEKFLYALSADVPADDVPLLDEVALQLELSRPRLV